MDRLACVDLLAFPLQLLLRQHTSWAGLPAAVVEADKPQARVLWVSEEARRAGVMPGQRYAHALGLAPGLRAGTVPKQLIEREAQAFAARLRQVSPEVEPYAEEPGVFWLSGAGLEGLHPTASAWGRVIVAALAEEGFSGNVVVGFSRFGTYAVSRGGAAPLVVFRNYADERRATASIPLGRLGMPAELYAWVHKLGVETLGGYVALPASGLVERFGHEALRLHQLASGTRWDPLQPERPPPEATEHVALDEPEVDFTRLLFWIKGGLDRLLTGLAERREALVRLIITLELDGAETRRETIAPAQPTLDHRVLMRLVHLRLEAMPPEAAVRELWLEAEGAPARREQLRLFFERPKRDLEAARSALAELCAELGNDAVCKVTLSDGHLPEAQFEWTPCGAVRVPRPRFVSLRPLVRRIHREPLVVPPALGSLHDDGWLLSGLEHGTVVELHGPYVVSGGWWRTGTVREYAYARTKRGELLWVYYDRQRRRWYIQGLVE